MVVAIATWSLVVHPGKKLSHEVWRDIKITNAALGAQLEDNKGRSTLKVKYELPPLDDLESDEESDAPKESPQKKAKKNDIALCSLTPGAIEQAVLDITFLEADIVEFEVVGKNSIHLYGNYIDQAPLPSDFPPDDFSDEESVDLRDVSSDVEIDPAELDGLDSDDEGRFEEIDHEKVSVGKKHPRDSDVMDTDVSMATSPSNKKVNKKLKGESGSAVPVTAEVEPKENGAGEPGSKKGKKDKKKDKAGKGESKSDADAPSTDDHQPSKLKPAGPTKDLEGGLKIRDFKMGEGKQAKEGNTVSMRYIGKLQDGTIFDQNVKGRPFTFELGKGEVIKGWDQGIVGMQVGGERLIIVPPALGFGNKSFPKIPRSSTLRFECKMLRIK